MIILFYLKSKEQLPEFKIFMEELNISMLKVNLLVLFGIN